MSNDKSVSISALLVANQLDIKGIRSYLDLKAVVDSPTELMITLGGDRFQYFFNYGVIVFSGQSEEEIKIALKSISPFLKNPISTWIRDDHKVEIDQDSVLDFEFDRIVVDHLDQKVFRITMLNLAQSVALDHYNHVTEGLLDEVKGFTRELGSKGKLSMNRLSMMKFIGRALVTKNEIADNVYIFDAPDLVWDDEFLDKLHRGLQKQLDLRIRFSEIEYTLRTISENLDTFREIYNQRENSLLEWIIIALILVEVFDLFISKFF
ncbi:MAG: RMD1 family protein [Cyclobacteriaceae bacterium]